LLWPSASYKAGANSLAFISTAQHSVMGCNFAVLFTQQGIYEIILEFLSFDIGLLMKVSNFIRAAGTVQPHALDIHKTRPCLVHPGFFYFICYFEVGGGGARVSLTV
jgi:hypothetical protein